MKTAGEIANKYLERVLEQNKRTKDEIENTKTPAQLRAELLEKMGIKR